MCDNYLSEIIKTSMKRDEEKMEILSYEYSGEGMHRVYENEKWTVGIKNWKPSNDITGIDLLERHNETDELFVLLSGSCTLIFAAETEDGLVFDKLEMERNKVYNIPKTLWHNTITQRDTKLILIEDSNTGERNSDFYKLSDKEIRTIQEIVK